MFFSLFTKSRRRNQKNQNTLQFSWRMPLCVPCVSLWLAHSLTRHSNTAVFMALYSSRETDEEKYRKGKKMENYRKELKHRADENT